MAERGRSRRLPVRLTWDGHEFLDLVRDESRWQKVVGSMAKGGSVPFGICKAVLLEMVRREAGEHLSLAE
jgi:hypothetical protein